MHDMHHMPENDHEAAMARADLYKLAQYSAKLFKMIQEGQQLEGWVQAKITKSADYIASVYHFMAYEMKVSEYGEALENAEVYENDLRGMLQQRLVEAKEKVKALKKVDAMKHKRHKTDKELEEMRQLANEEKSSTGGEIDRSKPGRTKHTQNPDRFSDEPHTEPKSQAKSQSAAEREKDKAADRAEEKEGKNYEKRFPGSVTRVKDGQKVKEGSLPMTTVNGKKVPAFAADGKGKNDISKGKAAPKKGVNPFAKVKETAISGAPQKSGIPATATTTVPGMKATQQDLKKAGASAALGEGPSAKTRMTKGDGNLANNAKPYDKVTRGDVIAGRLGKDEKGGKDKKDRIKEAVAAKCNESNKSKSCPVHGMKDCSTAKTNIR